MSGERFWSILRCDEDRRIFDGASVAHGGGTAGAVGARVDPEP